MALRKKLKRRPTLAECEAHGIPRDWIRAQGGLKALFPPKKRKTRVLGKTQAALAETLSQLLGGAPYESEKTFDWLFNPETQRSLRLDAYFPLQNLAVEYQSELHFGKKPRRFRTMDLRDVLYRDFVKRTLLAEHGVPLLEICFFEPHTPEHLAGRLRRLGFPV